MKNIKRKIKAGILCVLASLIMIGVCGCMFKRNPALSVNSCREHLEEKYGEKFTYLKPSAEDQIQRYSSGLLFQPESRPDVKILMQAYIDKEDVAHYMDNYLCYIYEDQTREVLYSIIKEVYGDSECKYVYNVSNKEVLDEEFGKSTSFEEFIAEVSNGINVDILLKPGYDPSDKKEKLRQLYNVLCKKKVVCCCDIYYTNDEEKYENCNVTIGQLSEIWWTEHGQLWLSGDFSLRAYAWMEDGNWVKVEDGTV